MPSAIDSSATVVKSGERASPRMAYLRSRARCFIVGRSAFGVRRSAFWFYVLGFWVLGSGSEPVRRDGTGEGWVGRTRAGQAKRLKADAWRAGSTEERSELMPGAARPTAPPPVKSMIVTVSAAASTSQH